MYKSAVRCGADVRVQHFRAVATASTGPDEEQVLRTRDCDLEYRLAGRIHALPARVHGRGMGAAGRGTDAVDVGGRGHEWMQVGADIGLRPTPVGQQGTMFRADDEHDRPT